MSKVHACSGRSDVLIVKEGEKINIKHNIEASFSNVLVSNIRFCPFCGMNLYQAK